MSRWVGIAVWAAAATIACTFVVWMLFGDYLRVRGEVDACLDSGGAWNYETEKCIGIEPRK